MKTTVLGLAILFVAALALPSLAERREGYREASTINELLSTMSPKAKKVYMHMCDKGCLSLTERTESGWDWRQHKWAYLGTEANGKHRVTEIKPPYQFWCNPVKYRKYRK